MPLTEKEQKILDSIHVPSEDDPKRPEFPPENPHYPSTPTFEINVPGIENVWVKDESVNPTGTHKDRMAWEMVVKYKNLLLAKQAGAIDELPQLSIISFGAAAIALQKVLKRYGLPCIKVLTDVQLRQGMKDHLRSIGCELFEADLRKVILGADDVLALTNNIGGINVSHDEALGPFDVFYDWMAYDILNQCADYVFMPYGTGHLFENVVNIAQREAATMIFHDKRFKGCAKKISSCNFIGAKVEGKNSIAFRLSFSNLPFVHLDSQLLNVVKKKGHIGERSGVEVLREEFLHEAEKIAEANNLSVGPSGLAGLAMLLQMKDDLPPEAKKLVINTGKIKYD